MKKSLIVCLLFSLASSYTFSQVNLDSLKAGDESNDYEAMNASVSYDFNMLMGIPDSSDLSLASRGVSMEFYYNKRFGESRFSFVAGLGFTSRNYFSKISYWAKDSLSLFPDSLEVDKNKLSVNSLTLPLELRFTSKPSGADMDKYFVFSTGLLGEYVFNSHTKVVMDNYTLKEKGRADLNNINTLRFGLQAKLSYANFGLGCYYGLNDLFDSSGPGPYRPISIKVFVGI